jgi:hypothetical protein
MVFSGLAKFNRVFFCGDRVALRNWDDVMIANPGLSGDCEDGISSLLGFCGVIGISDFEGSWGPGCLVGLWVSSDWDIGLPVDRSSSASRVLRVRFIQVKGCSGFTPLVSAITDC